VKLTIRPALESTIRDIVRWRYGPPFEFYDGDGEPPLNPECFFEARDEAGDLVGFYYFEKRGDAMFFGLGLRPDLTGRGLGLGFVRRGLEYGREHLQPRRVILDVAAFNERAIRVYARAGFRETGRKLRSFPRWGEVEFVDMELREDLRSAADDRAPGG
jgi:[ribosomal protein S18]-alanine N-acetyltransferase